MQNISWKLDMSSFLGKGIVHVKDHAHSGRNHSRALQYFEIDEVACRQRGNLLL